MIVCPICDTENWESPDFCVRCGAALLGGAPAQAPPRSGDHAGGAPLPSVAEREDEAQDLLVLELFDDPSVRIEVRHGQVVGAPDRTKVPDVPVRGVPDDQLEFISGHHARFTHRDSCWFVAHVGATNWIEVDGERCEDDTELALEDGSVVALTHAKFLVHIGDDDRAGGNDGGARDDGSRRPHPEGAAP